MEDKLELLTKLARDESTGPKVGEKFKKGLYYTATPEGYKPIFKSLITNKCVNDCKYCANRSQNNIKRVEFTPEKFAKTIASLDELNRISGAFISSGIYPSVNKAQENLYKTAKLLREKYKFTKYLHIKIMPGADIELIRKCANLADRVSVNTETVGSKHLSSVAKKKNFNEILDTLSNISYESSNVITQIMPGVVEDTDYDLIKTAESLYSTYNLKRVYYSAFRSEDNEVQRDSESHQREYRLYQCDRLMKDYDFDINEIFSSSKNLDLSLDPKANWAINNLDKFPIDINSTDKELLMKVPGIGPKTVDKIVSSRNNHKITKESIKGLRIPKKSRHFLEANGEYLGEGLDVNFIRGVLS